MSSCATEEDLIGRLAPRGAACVVRPTPATAFDLHPEEARAVAGASRLRQREFAGGRHCARLAVQRIGGPCYPILRGRRGAPQWPPGLVGSISHGAGLCAAVVGRQDRLASIGLDVETADPLAPYLFDLVCTEAELDNFSLPGRGRGHWAKVLFSAKEAFYKCYFPLAQTFLEFRDARIRPLAHAPHGGAFSIALTDTSQPLFEAVQGFHGEWALSDGRVFALVVADVATPHRQSAQMSISSISSSDI